MIESHSKNGGLMKALNAQLVDLFSKTIKEVFPDQQEIEIKNASHPKFGDYQLNSAMGIGKRYGKNPREVAEKIIEHLPADPLIERVEVAGPGFINIFLNQEVLTEFIGHMQSSSRFLIDLPKKKERIIVEFSSPNTAKELHVGHLRSTIIGDAIARIFEWLGHDVLRLNHVGDWGTAFGMLLAYLKENHPEVLSGKEADLSQLVEWYKKSKLLFDSDAAFKKRAQKEVVLLQQGDLDSLRGWELICAISRKAYEEIYALLDVKIQERGESSYNAALPEVVKELEEKGLIVVSDGAKCLFVSGFFNRDGDPLPLMIQKTDGGYGYDTTDMAAMRQRVQEERADRIIIVTDAGQATHFQMVYQAAVDAGYLDPKVTRFDHVPFGLVLGSDGKKFRTRSGEVEKLSDLLEKAIVLAEKMVEERQPDLPEDEKKRVGKVLGIGAVKYADLSCHRIGNYTFSYERMLQFEGNTATFILYSYVRTMSILKKVGNKPGKIVIGHPSERDLVLTLLRFPEVIAQVAEDLYLHRLTEYLYQVSNQFNAFYRDCKVEGSQEEASRLGLTHLSGAILKQGLFLLGIQTVDRM